MTLYNSSISQTDVYQVWQNQLLNTLGITRWVHQQSSVENVDVVQLLSAFEKPINLEYSSEVVSQTTSVTVVQPAMIDDIDENSDNYFVDNYQQLPNYYVFSDDIDQHLSVNNSITEKITQVVVPFQLQAMIVKNWILLADSKQLSENIAEAQLWQTICQNLNGTLQLFNFPLILSQETIADKYIEQMSSFMLAVASFRGFVCRMKQQMKSQPLQVIDCQMGAVTPLVGCLATQNIQRLPYLSEMLQDRQQKRQFWTRIHG